VQVPGRYTHRGAISHDRLVILTGSVAPEVLARVLLPVLPDGVVRSRHCRLLANRGRATKLARCRNLLRRGGPGGASRTRERGRARAAPDRRGDHPLSGVPRRAPARRQPAARALPVAVADTS